MKIQQKGPKGPGRSQNKSLPAVQPSPGVSGKVVQAKTSASFTFDSVSHHSPPAQESVNQTGMPHSLKAEVERLSGVSLDDVRVHYDSALPAKVDAAAYTHGKDIHMGPGKESALPHEAWHAVQQKQRRVKPTRQLKSAIMVNDDPGLEREADQMGGEASRQAAAGSETGSVPVKLPSASGTGESDIVQRKIEKDDKKYSFNSFHDLNGNPYLVDEKGANYKLEEKQPNIDFKPVAEDELPTAYSEDNRKKIVKNAVHGRDQLLEVGGSVGALVPFKSYQFGANTAPDVAVYNKDEKGPGRNWTKEIKSLSKKLSAAKSIRHAQAALAEFKKNMSMVSVGEDYRAQGAKAAFDEFVETATASFAASKPPKKKGDAEWEKLVEATVSKAQSLSFVGVGGKQKAREAYAPAGHIFQEKEVGIGLSTLSDDEDSPGGYVELPAAPATAAAGDADAEVISEPDSDPDSKSTKRKMKNQSVAKKKEIKPKKKKIKKVEAPPAGPAGDVGDNL